MNQNKKELHPDFPNIGQGVVLVMLLFLFEMFAMAFVTDVLGVAPQDADRASGIALVLANGALLTIVLGYKHLGYGALFHSSPRPPHATALLLPALALLVPALVLGGSALSAVLNALAPPTEYQRKMFENMAAPDPMQMITTCVLAPFLEEMLFRGVLLRSFLNQYDKRRAMVVSALMFGAFHMNLYQFVGGTLIGLLLAWLYERSRSLIPCIALHAMYNSGITVLVQAFGNDDNALADALGPPAWLIAGALAWAGALWLRRQLVPPAPGG